MTNTLKTWVTWNTYRNQNIPTISRMIKWQTPSSIQFFLLIATKPPKNAPHEKRKKPPKSSPPKPRVTHQRIDDVTIPCHL
jgi:hypothetical protein